MSRKIHAGDEVIQVNQQTVVSIFRPDLRFSIVFVQQSCKNALALLFLP